MFILSIDGTISLRYLLIVGLIISLVFVTLKHKHINNFKVLKQSKDFKLIIGLLSLFVGYVFFHSIFLSLEPNWSISEFKSHIVYPTIYFIVGLLLANYANNSKNISKESFCFKLFLSIKYEKT